MRCCVSTLIVYKREKDYELCKAYADGQILDRNGSATTASKTFTQMQRHSQGGASCHTMCSVHDSVTFCLVRRVSRRKSVYRFRIGQIFEIYQRSGPSLLDIWHSVPDPVVVKC